MNSFFLIPNPGKEGAALLARELKDYIEKNGGRASVYRPENGGGYASVSDVPADAECLITLGGDGTVLQAARDLVDLNLPVFGLNMGTLGYLTGAETKDAESAFSALMSGRYRIEERMLLSGEVLRNGQPIYAQLAMNDIPLRSCGPTRAMEIDLIVNGEFLHRYMADGMIIAAPTGSTAYNFSAGGPIVLPTAELMLATPLNAHTLMQRSLVLPGDAEVRLLLSGQRPTAAEVYFDGSHFSGLTNGDEVVVRKSGKKVKLVQLDQYSFLEVLKNKLGG